MRLPSRGACPLLCARLQDTKIVSLTITERGYCQSVDGHLDQNEPNIKHDLQDLSEPKSAIGT